MTIGPFVNWNPALSLLIISFALTLVSTLIYKYTTDQETIKSFKERTKQLQQEMRSLKDNPAQMMEKNKELMEMNIKLIKQ